MQLKEMYLQVNMQLRLVTFVQLFIKISDVHENLKDQMKLNLYRCEALSYVNITMETAFVGMVANY